MILEEQDVQKFTDVDSGETCYQVKFAPDEFLHLFSRNNAGVPAFVNLVLLGALIYTRHQICKHPS
jgi:hypothetical protein